jgi:thiamine pyrophosphokinase
LNKTLFNFMYPMTDKDPSLGSTLIVSNVTKSDEAF